MKVLDKNGLTTLVTNIKTYTSSNFAPISAFQYDSSNSLCTFNNTCNFNNICNFNNTCSFNNNVYVTDSAIYSKRTINSLDVITPLFMEPFYNDNINIYSDYNYAVLKVDSGTNMLFKIDGSNTIYCGLNRVIFKYANILYDCGEIPDEEKTDELTYFTEDEYSELVESRAQIESIMISDRVCRTSDLLKAILRVMIMNGLDFD